MTRRRKILLGCLALLALLALACTDLDIDRSGWGKVGGTPVMHDNPAADQHVDHVTDVTLERLPTATPTTTP